MSTISRIAKAPIQLPTGVTITLDKEVVTIKGPKGSVSKKIIGKGIALQIKEGKEIQVEAIAPGVKALTGSASAHLKKLIYGVTKGFEVKLELVGVGYRAQVQGKKLNLTLGFSHPVTYEAPAGIVFETPTQTEILIKGVDNHLVSQVAATIRRYREPEPYKGKGIRFAGERVKIKEIKKK